MFFKIACKALKRGGFINVIVIIQISIIMIISFITASSVCSRYTYYNMFKDYFSAEKGFFWVASELINPEGIVMQSTDEIVENIPEVKKAISCHKLWAESDAGSMYCISYDREITENFSPSLQRGRWISPDSENVEAVITQNGLGTDIGDKITLFPAFHEDEPVEVTIVGVLEENSAVPGFWGEYSEVTSFRNFYSNYNTEYEGQPALLMSDDVLSRYEHLTRQLAYKGFVIMDENTTKERMDEILKELSGFGCSYVCGTEEIKKNSMTYIMGEVYILLPVIVSVFILSCTSLISLSAITVKQELRNFAVFAICGLEWKKCIGINIISSLIMLGLSVLLTAAAGVFAYVLELTENMLLLFNIYTLSAVIGVALVFLIVSAIMPAVLIGSLTPKQVIAKE